MSSSVPGCMPPGVRKDRVETLRKAFKATFEDPEFVAEAKKTKLEMEYVSADEINGLVKEILEYFAEGERGTAVL